MPAIAIGASYLVWNDRLPDRIASHWSDLGAADDSLPTIPTFVGALTVTSLIAVAAIVVVALPKLDARAKRAALFWLGLPAGMAMSIWLVPAWLTITSGSAEEAVLGAWILTFFAAALYGVVPYVLAPRAALAPVTTVRPLELDETEVGAWSRTITANIFIWATVVIAGITTVIVITSFTAGAGSAGVSSLITMVVVVALVACFIRLRVTVDWRGLRVQSLVFGIPLKRIPLEKVRTVEATELRPAEWGGWGYRITGNGTAIILRGGPGLVVTTTGGSQFAITLRDPEIPAALLSALSGNGVTAGAR